MISYIFDKWWTPIIFCVFTSILCVISVSAKNNVLGNISFILSVFALLFSVISIIYQGIKRKRAEAILTFLVFCGTVGVLFFYSVSFLLMGPYFDGTDRWADNLTIPDNIQIEIPADLGYNEIRPSISNRQMTDMDFQLYNSFQPGLFEYDFWTGKIESGTIYLKAFEITQEYALSTKKLPAVEKKENC